MMEMMEEDPTLWGLDKFSGASCHKFLGCGVSIIHDSTYHFPSDIACLAPLLLTNGLLSTNGVRCSDTSADSSLTRAKHDTVRFLRRRVFGYSVFFIGRSVNATKKETVFLKTIIYSCESRIETQKVWDFDQRNTRECLVTSNYVFLL